MNPIMRSVKPLTEAQRSVLEFIREHAAQFGSSPTAREIADHFGFASQTAATTHVDAMIRKGILERGIAGKSRNIFITSRGMGFLHTPPAPNDAVDAARYRWLRDHSAGQFSHPIVVSQARVGESMRYVGPLCGEDLDRLIDAAREP